MIKRILLALLGGVFFRIRGGLIPRVPKDLSILVFIQPLCIFAWPLVGYWIIVPGVLTMLAVATGRGRWQSYKEPLRGDPEATEPVILWLEPHLSDYWYKFVGMVYSGLLMTVPFGFATLNPWIAFSGALQAIAYALGWAMYPKAAGRGLPGFNQATQLGEFFTGLFIWAIILTQ